MADQGDMARGFRTAGGSEGDGSRKCAVCGAIVDDGSIACPACGSGVFLRDRTPVERAALAPKVQPPILDVPAAVTGLPATNAPPTAAASTPRPRPWPTRLGEIIARRQVETALLIGSAVFSVVIVPQVMRDPKASWTEYLGLVLVWALYCGLAWAALAALIFIVRLSWLDYLRDVGQGLWQEWRDHRARAHALATFERLAHHDSGTAITPPLCASCRKPLPREEPDAVAIALGLPAFLGTVCRTCGRIECYRCRGGVGLCCSSCGGAVSPAYDHLFRTGSFAPH